MSVYIDTARIPYRGMLMSHMLADSLDELHAMARSIGMKPEWFQANASTPHYDVCQAKRAQAIKLGAIVVGRATLVEKMRRLRARLVFDRHREELLRDGGKR